MDNFALVLFVTMAAANNTVTIWPLGTPSPANLPPTGTFSQFSSPAPTNNTMISSLNVSTGQRYEVEVIFEHFSESRVSAYVQLISEVCMVPVDRLVTGFSGQGALEYGRQYIFPLRVTPLVGLSNNETVAEVAKTTQQIVTRLLSAISDRKSAVFFETMVHCAAVFEPIKGPNMEKAKIGVNYIWVSFLLMGCVMLVLSVLLVLRSRSAKETGDNGGGDPQSTTTQQAQHKRMMLDEDLENKFLAAVALKSPRLAKRRSSVMIEASPFKLLLDHDRMFGLPSVSPLTETDESKSIRRIQRTSTRKEGPPPQVRKSNDHEELLDVKEQKSFNVVAAQSIFLDVPLLHSDEDEEQVGGDKDSLASSFALPQ